MTNGCLYATLGPMPRFVWGVSRPYTPAGERIQDSYLWEGEVQPTSVPASGAQPMHMPAFASVKIEKSAEAKARQESTARLVHSKGGFKSWSTHLWPPMP